MSPFLPGKIKKKHISHWCFFGFDPPVPLHLERKGLAPRLVRMVSFNKPQIPWFSSARFVHSYVVFIVYMINVEIQCFVFSSKNPTCTVVVLCFFITKVIISTSVVFNIILMIYMYIYVFVCIDIIYIMNAISFWLLYRHRCNVYWNIFSWVVNTDFCKFWIMFDTCHYLPTFNNITFVYLIRVSTLYSAYSCSCPYTMGPVTSCKWGYKPCKWPYKWVSLDL